MNMRSSYQMHEHERENPPAQSTADADSIRRHPAREFSRGRFEEADERLAVEEPLEIHPHDAEQRGVKDGAWVKVSSRVGETTMRAQVTERVPPGVVYTTFHHQSSGTNIVTTENSDWATNCPEYKVTAVQVMPAGEANGPIAAAQSAPAHPAAGR